MAYNQEFMEKQTSILRESLKNSGVFADGNDLMINGQDGLTKEQMMERLNMTGGTFDTFRSRFRSKVRNFMIASDYYAAE